MRWRTVPMAILAAAVLAGCQDAQPAPGPSATTAGGHNEWDTRQLPDPCRLLTGAEVRRVLGEHVDAGERLETWPPLCALRLTAAPEAFLYVSADAGQTGHDDFDRRRSDLTAVRTVSSLGDQAYWIPDENALHVQAGDTYVVVKFAGARLPTRPQERAAAIARVVLPRAMDAPSPPTAGVAPGRNPATSSPLPQPKSTS